MFNKNRFIIDDLVLLPRQPDYYGYLCIVFKTNSLKDQVLATNLKKHLENYLPDHDEIQVTSK